MPPVIRSLNFLATGLVRTFGFVSNTTPHTGTLTETVLGSITIPAGNIKAGSILRILALGQSNNNANNKTHRIRLRQTSPTLNALFVSSTQTTNLSFFVDKPVAIRIGDAVFAPSGVLVGGGTNASASATAAVVLTRPLTIEYSVELANIADTATLDFLGIEG